MERGAKKSSKINFNDLISDIKILEIFVDNSGNEKTFRFQIQTVCDDDINAILQKAITERRETLSQDEKEKIDKLMYKRNFFYSEMNKRIKRIALEDIVNISKNFVTIKYDDVLKNPQISSSNINTSGIFFGIKSISITAIPEKAFVASEYELLEEKKDVKKYTIDKVNDINSCEFIKQFNEKSREEKNKMFAYFMNLCELVYTLNISSTEQNIKNLKQTFSLFEKILVFFIKLFFSDYIKNKSNEFLNKLIDTDGNLTPIEKSEFDILKENMKNNNLFETTGKLVLNEIYNKCIVKGIIAK